MLITYGYIEILFQISSNAVLNKKEIKYKWSRNQHKDINTDLYCLRHEITNFMEQGTRPFGFSE